MDTQSEKESNLKEFDKGGLQLKEFIAICISKWKWIATFTFLCLCIGITYLISKQPVYTRQAQILIKENSNGKTSFVNDLATVSDLGMFNNGINVNNELTCIQSPALIADVIKRLNLDVEYYVKERFGKSNIYGSVLPIEIHFKGIDDNETCSFNLSIKDESTYYVSELNIGKTEYAKVLECKFNTSIRLPKGIVVEVTKNPAYIIPTEEDTEEPKKEYTEFHIEKPAFITTVESYTDRLKTNLVNKQTTIFNLTFDDVSAERAEVFLNKLIEVYNENWIKEKNAIATNTSEFINERLKLTEQDLGSVDNSISAYKSKNLTPDLTEVAKLHLDKASVANDKVTELSTQLNMALYIRNCVAKNKKRTLLPSVDALKNSMIANSIDQYNTTLIQRNSLAENSSAKNPLVVDLDKQLNTMEKGIIESINNQISSLKQQISVLRNTEAKSTAKVANSPTLAKHLLSVERQQKVKETLYLYLLQKREENELARAYSVYNSRVITPPTGGLKPTSPIKRNVILVCLIIGILLPIGIIYLIELFNNQIRGKKDLSMVDIPLIGEVPLLKHKKKSKEIVVEADCRDNINEAFRIVRTNIEKAVGGQDGSKVLAVTSANIGSGKTFTSVNTAKSLSLLGYRVAMVDMDLRRANLSKKFSQAKQGLSSFLKGETSKVQDLMERIENDSNLHLLPVGELPSNPNELLRVSKLEQLLAQLRDNYDYIILNCPPVEMIADTSIIAPLADLTLFVVRVRMFDKKMLPSVQNFYDTKKYGSMVLLLNATVRHLEKKSGNQYVYG